MKTKEEILKPYLTKIKGEFVVTENCALKAMEEYADQFKPTQEPDLVSPFATPTGKSDEFGVIEKWSDPQTVCKSCFYERQCSNKIHDHCGEKLGENEHYKK